MRATEFIVETAMMGKIADSGKIIRILKKAHTVPFSDEKNWLLVDTDPGKGNSGLGIKWIPADTRFEWVRPYKDTVDENLSPQTIHKLADRKGVKWDNEPSFLQLTKRLTGKEHLDDLDHSGLNKVKRHLDGLQGVAEGLKSGRQRTNEKINPEILSRKFRKQKDLGWYRLEAQGDALGRAVTDPPTLKIVAKLVDKTKPEHQWIEIGEAIFFEAPKEGPYAINNTGDGGLIPEVSVHPEYQRKGIASEMYKFVKELGNDVVRPPSGSQSDDAVGLWKSFEKQPQGVAEDQKINLDTDYFMNEGCGIFAVATALNEPGSQIYIISNKEGESWSKSFPYEITHVFANIPGKGQHDVRGKRSLEEMASDFGLDKGDYSVKGPFDPKEFFTKFMGNSDSKPLYGTVKDIKQVQKQIQPALKQGMAEGASDNIPTMGINVRSDGDIDYASLIVDGEKKYESRKTDSLRPYVGKIVGIVRTGNGPAVAIGQVTIGEPIIVDAEKFNRFRKQHLVPQGSKFDIDSDGTKYLYPMIDPVRWDNEKPIKHRGIVSRKIQEQGVAEDNLKEFAPGPGGGESGRWYTDDQMTDLVGDGWWNDLDISGEVSKQEMIQEAQAWLDDQGYSVHVLNCKVNDDDMEWFIEGSFQNSGFAKKGMAEGSENNNPIANKIFFARSNKAPKGWSYDHVGFITQDGKQIQMSGHKGNDVYVTNAVTDDPEFPKQNIKIVSLSKPVSVPTTNSVGAENCGTFVANVLQANGIKGIDTQKIYSVFKKPQEQGVAEEETTHWYNSGIKDAQRDAKQYPVQESHGGYAMSPLEWLASQVTPARPNYIIRKIVVIGDSIAVGIGQAIKGAVVNATVGINSSKILSNVSRDNKVQGAKLAIVSAGSNDIVKGKGNPQKLTANIAAIKDALNAEKYVWILPYDKVASQAVSNAVGGDKTVDLKSYPSSDGLHPSSYSDVAKAARAGLNLSSTAPGALRTKDGLQGVAEGLK